MCRTRGWTLCSHEDTGHPGPWPNTCATGARQRVRGTAEGRPHTEHTVNKDRLTGSVAVVGETRAETQAAVRGPGRGGTQPSQVNPPPCARLSPLEEDHSKKAPAPRDGAQAEKRTLVRTPRHPAHCRVAPTSTHTHNLPPADQRKSKNMNRNLNSAFCPSPVHLDGNRPTGGLTGWQPAGTAQARKPAFRQQIPAWTRLCTYNRQRAAKALPEPGSS